MATLKFKRSAVPGKAPTIADIELGEVAINTYDGKLYLKKDDGTQSIVDVGAGGGSAGVSSFNTRTGAVTLTSGDVTGALGFTPYNATNPSGYTSNTGTVTSVDISGGTTGLTASGGPITSSGSITLGGTLNVANGGTGANTLTANAILKGNGTSAISASSITDNGTLVTIAEPVRLSTPNTSSAAWTTSGINLIQSAATFTDTTSTGTVGQINLNNFAAQTLAASNTLTVSTLFGTYFTNPLAGTNVTAQGRYALGCDNMAVLGTLQASGTLSLSGPNNTSTASFATATTSSGNTKTLNIGTNGASGSTTNISIGSATSGATSTTTLNGDTTFTGTIASGPAVDFSNRTSSVTATIAGGATASGSTKTLNLGTNGTSGSTTNITLGSATSGATQSTTINGRVTLAPIGASAAAWTTSGIGLVQSAATFTDTSSTGTVSQIRINNFAAQTLAASNTTTVSNLYGTYFANPVAGTNVTISSGGWAVGADSLRVNGTLSLTGTLFSGADINLVGPTTTVTHNFVTGVTASGSTKTVNIGTGGASGSTTNITLGSSTSGATQTTTVNGQVTLAPIGGSAAAWTTGGIALKQSAATWTDTSSTGTVAAVRMNNFAAQTMAASNVITVTDLSNVYIPNAAAGANVTATRAWSLAVDSLWVSNGRLWQQGSAFSIQGSSGSTSDLGAAITNGSLTVCSALTTGTFTLGSTGGTGTITLGQSTASQTTNIQAGTTASGSTKTVNIGTGGASGSTTNITIGSATSGATSTITLNGGVKTLSAATTSGATITPTADTTNQYNVTALATGATFAAPSGTPVDSQKLMLRIKDNGTGQTLAWNAIYRAIGTTLPTTTTANKTIYVGCVYNSADTKWDVVAVATEA